MAPKSATDERQSPKLLDQLRTGLRVRHRSLHTEQAYCSWVKRFILFHSKRHPAEMGALEITAFLNHLAEDRTVAASTQNQALNALVFLYRYVLEREVGKLEGLVRAKKPPKLPVVLTRAEVRAVCAELDGFLLLFITLLYGTGMRLQECLRLRVHDVDFERRQITVRNAKGGRDRWTMLPATVIEGLKAHLEWVGILTERFNSCRNRHCPKCQFLDKARWLEKRVGELLPLTYFHLVFTVPDPLLNPLVRRNEAQLYKMLFRVVADTLLEIAADPKHLGAKVGFLAVLHTWGQLLQLHPHLHVIVPAGGLSPAGDQWVSAREDFFLPVRVLSRRMRTRFCDVLDEAVEGGGLLFPEKTDPQRSPKRYRAWREKLFESEWVSYAKKPFGGKEAGLAYLARYTYRVAVSNDRLLRLEDGRVHFRYKDYADGSAWKDTSLEALEFLRRYLMHVLPPGFHRIRYYGLFANRCRAANLERCRALLGVAVPEEDGGGEDGGETEPWDEQLRRLTGVDPTRCPACKEGRLVYVELLVAQPRRSEAPAPPSRAPP